jgi:alpha-glucuronidase
VKLWDSLKPYVDKERHRKIADKLSIQLSDAKWWRDACVQYFASLNGLPVPEDVEKPVIPLDSLKRVHLDRK